MATPQGNPVRRFLSDLPAPPVVRDVLLLAWDTLQNYGLHRGGETAAAIAYYSLFSIFPLILFVVSVASLLLGGAARQDEFVAALASYIPGSEGLLQTTVRQVVAVRGPVTMVAILALLWSASGASSMLLAAIERAWHAPAARPVWKQKLAGLTLTIVLGLLVVTATAASGLIQVIQRFGDSLVPQAAADALRRFDVIGYTAAAATNSLAFLVLYKWAPTRAVPWRIALLGAVPAGVGWELAKAAFAWYLSHYALRGFSLVYGSVGAVIALVFWIYVSAVIILLGAELCAAFGQRQ